MTLLSTVGGASGPLYLTFFLQAASKSAGKTELDLAGWTDCLAAALAGVEQRGKAVVGDKTMVDALQPAVEALKHSDGKELGAALAASAEASEAGMKATIPLVARKGRASYLGEPSAAKGDCVALVLVSHSKALAGWPGRWSGRTSRSSAPRDRAKGRRTRHRRNTHP
jgi:dihydroxyacetone kinase-like protein